MITNGTNTDNLNHESGKASSWYLLKVQEAASTLCVDPAAGLDKKTTIARQEEYGENKLAETPPRSKWFLFFDQFKSLLTIVLLGAAALAGAIGDITDAVVILVVVTFNALLGFWQEYRAEATLAALKKMLSPMARVRRDGQVEEISTAHIVPGDIVLLEAGDRVPADGRLVATHTVEIDEAALTGESHPVEKEASAAICKTVPLAEQINMAFMNTVVTRGRAELLVTSTGMNTEMGRISGMLAADEGGPTPLQKQLDGLGKRLTLLAGVVITLILILGLWRGEPWMQVVLTSIALAVAAIPEGLPAVVTVTLAIGMHRMAKHQAIVKKLAAVETLGCTTVICSDKTGTLTMNQMTARTLIFRGQRISISGEGYGSTGEIKAAKGEPLPDMTPLLYPAVLANDSNIHGTQLIGDPTEGALLALASKGGLDCEQLRASNPRIAEIPFDSSYKFQASFHRDGDQIQMYVKGAPDVLLSRADRQLAPKGEIPLDKASWIEENEQLGTKAMRVLALASKTISAADFDPDGDLMTHVEQLIFVGLVGIIDPPRSEARDAIALCKQAGIRVKMITGDHQVTAAAIAHELGLDGDVLEGRELDLLSPEQLSAKMDNISVFARVAPEHKVRIVQALKADGHVTAMTGDGVNDAPALKKADIGVAMGITGTEVTKEAATMVLTDDNFATIVNAVKEGRAIYDNIVKFVRFQLSTNMGAIQTVLGASLLGWATPFTAIQILWINIIMDGPPAMSLGVEPARKGIMDDSPRPRNSHILSGPLLLTLFIYGLIMTVGTLSVFHYAKPMGGTYALTLAFTTFVLFQFFNLFNVRNEHASVFNSLFFRNRWLWLSLLTVFVLQTIVVHWTPAQEIFRTTDLMWQDWALATVIASSILLLEESRKFIMRTLK